MTRGRNECSVDIGGEGRKKSAGRGAQRRQLAQPRTPIGTKFVHKHTSTVSLFGTFD
ncbi:unnamed protein product [Anisakis simplex]|uniref:Uncharacterized protein n=1 Tax=Anisakis simplex TaxID=6269 RepID=A0A0M3JNA6_ANISI|nr:unnamed protein product [Anisakis simplex]